jgi:Ca-activated chloride channel family protein
MSTSHEHDPLEPLFENARRHESAAAPRFDELLERAPARAKRAPALRFIALWTLTAAVAATAAAFLAFPSHEPLPPGPSLSSLKVATPPPPPAMPSVSADIELREGHGEANGLGPAPGRPDGAALDRLQSLGSAGAVKDKKNGEPSSEPPLVAQSHRTTGTSGGVVGGVAGGVVGGVLGGVPAAPKDSITVEVVAKREALNVQATSTSTKFSDEFLTDLPVQGRFYKNMLTQAPGVLSSDGDGNPNVQGARSRDFKEAALDSGSGTERYGRIEENDFLGVSQNPLSTFSIDVDTASYAVVRRFLNQGQLPPANAVRIEELLNYFPYAYAEPNGNEPFSVGVEIASCPWSPTHRLARIGLKGRDARRDARRGTNLVFLIDVSGSMQEPDKLPLLKSSLGLLVDQLGANDDVAIVVYAGASGLVLPSTPASRRSEIRAALDSLEAGGSTNGGEGLRLAYRTAREHFLEGGVNRIILATDGDFNVGVTDHGELLRLVEDEAKRGIALTTLGFGMGNYKDDTLELLADRGNGNYAYIDDLKEARKVLVEQVGGTLVTIAKDVKIQVEFNPAVVGAYRLIGYENRMLRKEDFNDDRKDAGEIGSGHTVTALYELVPGGMAADLPSVDALKYQTHVEEKRDAASAEAFTVKLRYKEPDGEKSRLLSVPVVDSGVTMSGASEDLRFAASVAAFGMVLRNSPHKGSASLDLAARLATEGMGADAGGYRRSFLDLVEKARPLLPR